MPFHAILLLLFAAVLHTAWNLLLKRTQDRNIVTWWAVLVGSGLFLPVLIFTGLPHGRVWILLSSSVVLEVIYYLTLAGAYRAAEFSLVYPLARGAAPALIATWAVIFLDETLTIGGILGLGTIIVGLLVIGASGLITARASGKLCITPGSWKGIILSAVLALIISIYSTIDAAAVRQTAVLPYTILVFVLAPLLTAPLVIWRYRMKGLLAPWQKQPWTILGIGFMTLGAYLLALLAYSSAPLGYSGAVREVSVVLGAFAGWTLLGEKMGVWRLAGAGVVFTGILMVAFLG